VAVTVKLGVVTAIFTHVTHLVANLLVVLDGECERFIREECLLKASTEQRDNTKLVFTLWAVDGRSRSKDLVQLR